MIYESQKAKLRAEIAGTVAAQKSLRSSYLKSARYFELNTAEEESSYDYDAAMTHSAMAYKKKYARALFLLYAFRRGVPRHVVEWGVRELTKEINNNIQEASVRCGLGWVNLSKLLQWWEESNEYCNPPKDGIPWGEISSEPEEVKPQSLLKRLASMLGLL